MIKHNKLIKIYEDENQSAIIKLLLYYEKLGKLMIWRTNNGGIFDKKRKSYRTPGKGYKRGVADLTALINGRYIGIEVKSSFGKQSGAQKIFQKQVEKNGGLYYCINDLSEVAELIPNLINELNDK